MKRRAARLKGMSVRWKLFLLAGGPVLVTSAVLLGLFLWAHEKVSRAYEHALAWERHAASLQSLEWAARFFVDAAADSIVAEPMPHEAESLQRLERARAEALARSRSFSAREQAAQQRLDTALDAFVEEGRHVGGDRARLNALAESYRLIDAEIRSFLEEEERGAVRAIRSAHDLSDNVRAGGLAVAILALFAAVGVSAVAIRGFGGRVASLEAAAARVAGGDLEGGIPVTSGDELGRLSESLNAMLEALRRQRTRQLGFLAAVAHDLRNPLAAMRLSTHSLLQSADLPPAPVLRKGLGLIDRQIERLTRLADDLLDAASIESGELKLSPRACDLTALARDVVDLYAGTSRKHELRLSVPGGPVTVVCDPTRIGQVLDNIVNNAIKYSPGGGVIELVLTAGDDEATVSVSDHGVGIDPEMTEAIFEPFRRVTSSKEVLPGVGLGLSICRRIVVAHGGRIDVESRPGRGSTFRIRLPRQATPRWK